MKTLYRFIEQSATVREAPTVTEMQIRLSEELDTSPEGLHHHFGKQPSQPKIRLLKAIKLTAHETGADVGAIIDYLLNEK